MGLVLVVSDIDRCPDSSSLSSFPRQDNGIRYGSFPLKDFTENTQQSEALQELLKIFQKVNLGKQLCVIRWN